MEGGGALLRFPGRKGKGPPGQSQRQTRGAGEGSSAWEWSTRGAPRAPTRKGAFQQVPGAVVGAVSGEGLELVGRQCDTVEDHELFVTMNSHRCLVVWKDTSGLLFDRFDVRHLLDRLPEERKHQASHLEDAAESQEDLDEERYRDLRKLEEEGDQAQESFLEPAADASSGDASSQEAPSHAAGQHGSTYAAVPFSYESDNNQAQATLGASEQAPVEDPFAIPIPLPPSFSSALPQTEKLYNILVKTARFVSKHGPQSEIVLRVKQGDSPNFGFLMPAHPLHTFFRLLVESPPESTPTQQPGQGQQDTAAEATGGGTGRASAAAVTGPSTAFALLGQAYGDTEEDEEEEVKERSEQEAQGETLAGQASGGTERTAPTAEDEPGGVQSEEGQAAEGEEHKEHLERGDETSRVGDLPADRVQEGALEEHAPKNASGHATGDTEGGATREGMQQEAYPTEAIQQPDEVTTQVIMKMVEYIARNGAEFEAIVRQRDEQDAQRHWEQTGQPGPRRFPFLDSQHAYHPFFSACLRQALPSAAQDSTQQPVPSEQQQQQQYEQGGENEVDEQTAAQDEQDAPEGSALHPAKRQKQEQESEQRQEQGQEPGPEKSQGDGEAPPEKKPGPVPGRVRVGWIPKVKPQFVRKRKKDTEVDEEGGQEEGHMQKEGKGEEALVKKEEEVDVMEKVEAVTGQEAVMEQGVQEQVAEEEAPVRKPAVTVSAALAAVLAATSRKTPPPDDRPGQEQGTDAPTPVHTSMQEPLAAEPKPAHVEPGLANGGVQQAEPRRKLSAAEVAALVRKGKAGLGGRLGADKPPQEPEGRRPFPSQQNSSQPVAVALQLDEELLQELEGPSEPSQPQPSTRLEPQREAGGEGDTEKQRLRKKRLEKARQLAAMMKDKQSGSGAVLPSSSQGVINANEQSHGLHRTAQDTAKKKGVELEQRVAMGDKVSPFGELGRSSAQGEVLGTSHIKVPDPRIRHADFSQLLKLRTEAAQEIEEERGHVEGT